MQEGDVFVFKNHEANTLAGPCVALFVYADDTELVMVDILMSNGKHVEQLIVKKEEIELRNKNDVKDW